MQLGPCETQRASRPHLVPGGDRLELGSPAARAWELEGTCLLAEGGRRRLLLVGKGQHHRRCVQLVLVHTEQRHRRRCIPMLVVGRALLRRHWVVDRGLIPWQHQQTVGSLVEVGLTSCVELVCGGAQNQQQ